MDNQPSVEVFKRVNTVVKKTPKTILKKVKSDGSVAQASKIIDKLIANKTRYFEVCNLVANKKVIYQLNISGKNYTTKIVKI